MYEILFVDSCIRGEISRTRALAGAFLKQMGRLIPDMRVTVQDLTSMSLRGIDRKRLDLKESLCDAAEWEHPIFDAARAFVRADGIVIAAPYWDLSFPSALKVWVENIYARNLTFHYENDRCVGHARAKACAYISTSGSPVGQDAWDTGYIRAVMRALGVPELIELRAEGLDLDGNDAQAILDEAAGRAAETAEAFARLVTV